MENQLTIIISTLAIIIAAGCVFNNSDNALEPLDRDPYITGELTQIDEGEDYNVILVEENPKKHEPAEPGGVKIWFTLTEETEILTRSDDGSLSKYPVKKLRVGQMVEGWAVGAVADSYPQQGGAKRIVVVDE